MSGPLQKTACWTSPTTCLPRLPRRCWSWPWAELRAGRCRCRRGRRSLQPPDALRRFRIMNNVEELAAALEYPWERWTVFLHPDQRGIVERNYNGSARVSGSAGTGKTVVALHRAAHLARTNPDARVLLTTFSEALANQLRSKLKILTGDESEVAGRVEVQSLDAVSLSIYESRYGTVELTTPRIVEELIVEAVSAEGTNFALTFVTSEWERVIDAWQLSTWEDYREVRRIGRYRRLSEAQRESLWPVFEQVRIELRQRGLITKAEMFGRLTTETSLLGKKIE